LGIQEEVEEVNLIHLSNIKGRVILALPFLFVSFSNHQLQDQLATIE
jgi:hypothetical protein